MAETKIQEEGEEMLKEDIGRYTLFPIKHADIWEAYKRHVSTEWKPEELDYDSDKNEWICLTPNEKKFLENVLAFFAGADGVVLENLMSNFAKEVQWPEARAFYAFQGHMEQIHSETYSRLIDSYIDDPKRRDELFRGIETIPCVKKKTDWALKWINPEKSSFAERLVAFAIVEGIFFSGSFCAIFWLKSRNIMVTGLGKSNELIARDEGLHCLFAILLYSKLKYKLTKKRIHEIFSEAVEIEIEFITESIPCDLIGMNNKLMTKYIKYIADYWMHQIKTTTGHKCPKLYNVKNPFSFMDRNGMDGKTDFFSQRVSEYTTNISTMSSRGSETFSNINDSSTDNLEF